MLRTQRDGTQRSSGGTSLWEGAPGWPGMLGKFVLSELDTMRYAGPTPLNTDDRLRLELTAPRALYRDTYRPNLDLIRQFRLAEQPDMVPEGRSP